MKKITIITAVLILFSLGLNSASAQSALALKICSNTTKGTLVARVKCKKGESALTPSSFTGPQGAVGATGATGARGPSAFDAIPSGTTVYGVIGNDANEAGATAGDWYGFASLPAKTSQILTNADVIVANTSNIDNDCAGSTQCLSDSELADSSVCTGNTQTPTAPAGKVCIYITGLSASNTFAKSISGYVLAGSPATITPGFMLAWRANATGDTYIRAVWAYTAP